MKVVYLHMTQPADELSANAPQPQDEAAILRTMLLRLVPMAEMSDPDQPQLFISALPPAFADLPLPPQSTLLGSIHVSLPKQMNSMIGMRNNVSIILDSALSPEAVLDFYRTVGNGWGEPSADMPGPPRGGFTMPFFQNRLVLVSTSKNLMLNVIAVPTEQGQTAVRLNLNDQAVRFGQHHFNPMDLLPAVAPPRGAQQTGGGGGGGDTYTESSAQLVSDLNLAALKMHYEQQIAAQWAATTSGIDGPVAWSRWTFSDKEGEPWRGLFFILSDTDRPGNYSMQLRADWQGK